MPGGVKGYQYGCDVTDYKHKLTDAQGSAAWILDETRFCSAVRVLFTDEKFLKRPGVQERGVVVR
jgi:hypothetical protein